MGDLLTSFEKCLPEIQTKNVVLPNNAFSIKIWDNAPCSIQFCEKLDKCMNKAII